MTERVPFARGRECDLYSLRSGWVARLYRHPDQTSDREARAMAYAHAHGYPVPRVRRSRGRLMVIERVDGPTMLEQMLAHPHLARRHIALLADLHARLHAIDGPDWLDRPFGEGGSLLHLDLHPGNVIMSDRGPVVIDWTNVAGGPPAADLAQTWLLLSSTRAIDGVGARRVRRAADLLAREFARVVDIDLFAFVSAAIEHRLQDDKVPQAEAEELARMRRFHMQSAPAHRARTLPT